MVHAALLLLMLEAANARPRFTISLKRSTQNLQLSTSRRPITPSFTPCFLWIFLGAPFVETLRANKAVGAALAAVTAAVVGVILNLAVWFAIHNVFHSTIPVRAFPLS